MHQLAPLPAPPATVGSYDEFLGRFVDAVQLSGVEFLQLRREWLAECPLVWQKRFHDEVVEIEWLLSTGALCRVEAEVAEAGIAEVAAA